jgi:ribosome biogenesis protein Nip4
MRHFQIFVGFVFSHFSSSVVVSRCFIREPGPPFNKSFLLSFGKLSRTLEATNNFMQAILFPPKSLFSLSLSLSLSQKDGEFDIFGNDRPEFAPISSHKIWVTLHQGNAL